MTRNFKKLLTIAKNGASTVHHLFLLEYKASKNHIYCFVEGAEDICFYQNFLKNYLNDRRCETHFYPCGNKESVLNIYSRLDMNIHSKNNVLFFVDKDFSLFLDRPIKKHKNLYITDGYSIENSIITDELLVRHLQESGAFPILPEKTKKILKKQFNSLKNEFCLEMLDVIIWFVSLKLSGAQPSLKNLSAKRIISISKMQILSMPQKSKKEVFAQCTKCLPKTNMRVRVAFYTKASKHKYIKGKYLSEFFKMFIQDLFKSYGEIDYLKNCKKNKDGVDTNIENIAHRCKCPHSLTKFFNNTVNNI